MAKERIENLLQAAFSPKRPDEKHDADTADRVLKALESSGPAATPGERYALDDEVGRGGMGVVYRAADHTLGREIAIKYLRDELRDNPALRERFLEEARIAGQLQHPGIVPVHDVAEDADGKPYFTMRLVRGRTLRDLIRERASADEQQRRLLGVFEKVCEAVAYAHARGVVHRDLKPANVMVGEFGEVQVMDWGLAKVLADLTPDAESPPITGSDSRTRSISGSVVGTPAYMAPEQARGETDRIDARTDVFTLGAMLCEILTGEPPYGTASNTDPQSSAAAGDLAECHRRLDEHVGDGDLAAIARRCLAPDPADRPADAGEVAAAITGHLTAVEARAHAAEVSAAEASARWGAERRARRMTLIAAGAAIAAILIGVAAFLYLEAKQRQRYDDALGGVLASETDAETARAAGRWNDATSAIRQARTFMRSTDLGPEIAQRVDALSSRVKREAAEAKRIAEQRALDTRTERLLTELRSTPNSDLTASGNNYVRAFREYGIDLTRQSAAEAAERIRASAIREPLILALDQWASPTVTTDTGRKHFGRLREIANQADPDERRRDLRERFARDDLPGIRAIAASLDPKKDAVSMAVAIAKFFARQNLRGEARALLNRFYPRSRDDVWINLELAQVGLRQTPEAFAASLGYMRTAVALQPRSPAMRLHLTSTFLGMGDLKRAQVELEAARELAKPTAFFYHVEASILARNGDKNGAINALRSAYELEPEDDFYRIRLAEGLLVRDPKQAIPLCRAVLKRHPNSVRTLYTLARAHHLLGQIDEALAGYERVLALAESNGEAAAPQVDCPTPDIPASARLEMVRVLAPKGRLRRAMSTLRKLLETNPDSPQAQNLLGQCLCRIGRTEEGLDVLRRSAEAKPNDGGGWWDYGLGLVSSGRYEEALEFLDRAGKLKPQLRRHTSFLNRTRRDARSARVFQEVLDGESELDPVHRPRFFVFCFEGGYTLRAAEVFEDIRDETGADVNTLCQGARATGAAATGWGKDAKELDATARAKWRGIALECLERAVTALETLATEEPEHRNLVYYLEVLRACPHLEGLRAADALRALPEADRRRAEATWKKVDELLDVTEP